MRTKPIALWSAMAMLVFMGVCGTAHPMPAAALDSPASLTIEVYTCDSLNDPIEPNQTLIDECNLGTDDISFTLEGVPSGESGAGASTGTGGAPATIIFSQLTPGSYRLTQETPATIGLSYISQCTSNLRTFTYPLSPFAIIEPGGRVTIELLAGEELTCRWYNVQSAEPEASSLTVTAYSCDGDVIDAALCDLAAGVEFAITGPDGSVDHITTNARGVATFDGAGEFQIDAVSELPGRDFCAFDAGRISTGGTLTLDPTNPITVDAYYCYPGA